MAENIVRAFISDPSSIPLQVTRTLNLLFTGNVSEYYPALILSKDTRTAVYAFLTPQQKAPVSAYRQLLFDVLAGRDPFTSVVIGVRLAYSLKARLVPTVALALANDIVLQVLQEAAILRLEMF